MTKIKNPANSYHRVINFWFNELTAKQWFIKSTVLDDKIRNNFERLYQQIIAGEKSHWRKCAEGRLAEIIVLDQFSRNMYRNNAKSFQADMLALALAQTAIQSGDYHQLESTKRVFMVMPFMHSESKQVHIEAEKIFAEIGGGNYNFELKHKNIIDQFGRYPYRNKILGRKSTKEEIEWMLTNKSF